MSCQIGHVYRFDDEQGHEFVRKPLPRRSTFRWFGGRGKNLRNSEKERMSSSLLSSVMLGANNIEIRCSGATGRGRVILAKHHCDLRHRKSKLARPVFLVHTARAGTGANNSRKREKNPPLIELWRGGGVLLARPKRFENS